MRAPALRRDGFAWPRLPKVRGNVRLIQGWFDKILPDFWPAHQGPALFRHIDSDLYSSARTVFTLFRDRIRPGTVIVFDEFFNYSGWKRR